MSSREKGRMALENSDIKGTTKKFVYCGSWGESHEQPVDLPSVWTIVTSGPRPDILVVSAIVRISIPSLSTVINPDNGIL